MKIAFIYPSQESLGVEYLISCLLKEGHTVELIFDPVLFGSSSIMKNAALEKIFHYRKRLLRRIIDLEPDLICFSVITDDYQWAIGFAEDIKKMLDVPIVFGGIHPTLLPERTLQENAVDFVCVGEGETAIVRLANGLAGRKDVSRIPGIGLKDKDGKIIRNEPLPFCERLDSLPFPDKVEFYKKAPHTNYGYMTMAARGCLYRCSYCCNSYLKKTFGAKKPVRHRSVKNVIAELRFAKKKHNAQFVVFEDEIFTSDAAWIDRFLPAYKQDIGLPFSCWLHPNHIDDEMAIKLKGAGCYEAQMGVQSLDPIVQKTIIYRNTPIERIAKAVRALKKSGIYCGIDVILGLPLQTIADIEHIVEFYIRERPDFIFFFGLRYYPKTDILDIAVENGCLSVEQKHDFENKFSAQNPSRGGDAYTPDIGKLQTTYVLSNFLPTAAALWIINNKRYRFIPALPPSLLVYILKHFRRSRFDYISTRFLYRTIHFMLRRLIPERGGGSR